MKITAGVDHASDVSVMVEFRLEPNTRFEEGLLRAIATFLDLGKFEEARMTLETLREIVGDNGEVRRVQALIDLLDRSTERIFN